MHDIKKILVVSTSMSISQKSIHYGMALARQLGADLFVHHSTYNPFIVEGWGLPMPSLGALREECRASQEEARAELNRMIEQEKVSGTKISVTVTEEPLAKMALRTVEQEKIDLMVLSAYGESRIEHLFFGSDVHDIVRRLPCSVLLVKELRPWEEADQH